MAGRASHRPGADGAHVRPAVHRHHGLADAGDLRARHRRSVVGRQGDLRLGVGGGQAPYDQHEHPRDARHGRRLGLQHVRHSVARPRPELGPAPARLLRDRPGDRGAGAGRKVHGGQSQEAHGRCGHCARRTRTQDSPGAPRRDRGRHPGRGGRRRRRGPDPSGREDPGRRRGRQRYYNGRREHADRREPAGGQVRGRPASSAPPSTPPGPSRSGSPLSGTTPRWPRSFASSRTRRAPRCPCSDWPTGSRRSSFQR